MNNEQLHPTLSFCIQKCPVCENELAIEPHEDGVVVWCSYGPCPSYVCNEGATGKTAEDAAYKLWRAVEEEITMNDQEPNNAS